MTTLDWIETARLKLRHWEEADIEAHHAIITGDEDVMEWLETGMPLPEMRAQRLIEGWAEHWMLYGFGVWAVEESESGQLIGHCGLLTGMHEQPDAELRFAIGTAFQGRGYATEAAIATIRYGLHTLRRYRVLARIVVGNTDAYKVMARCGATSSSQPHKYWGRKVETIVMTINNFTDTDSPIHIHETAPPAFYTSE